MNWDLSAAIIFYALIILYYFTHKEKFTTQGRLLILYKTKLGLTLMDKISKRFPRSLNTIGYVSILTGFLGMIGIVYLIITKTIEYLTTPGTQPPLAPVFPGVSIPGAPTLGFWHWIIAIFIVAVVHELSHGIYARANDIRVKSSGFAFLGPILAAFVEPDEKELEKKSKKAQLSVLSAGPFSNILLGLVFLAIIVFVSTPIQNAMLSYNGIGMGSTLEGYPAREVVETPVIIKQINQIDTLSIEQFINATKDIKPGDKVTLITNKGDYELIAKQNPNNPEQGFLGITDLKQEVIVKESFKEEYGNSLPPIIEWMNLLIAWLFIINIGIGLFNLLPLAIVDGGRMFYLAMLFFFKKEKTAKLLWKISTVIILTIIFIDLLPYLTKLISWVIKPFIYLIALI